ncbi:hypothetical protein ACHAWF_006912, partial [Thalassiosira exigua]
GGWAGCGHRRFSLVDKATFTFSIQHSHLQEEEAMTDDDAEIPAESQVGEAGEVAVAPTASAEASMAAGTSASAEVEDFDDAPTASAPRGPPPPLSRRRHLVDVFRLTYPIVASEFFQNTLPVVDLAFVGRLGKDELGAAALATVWFNLWNTSMIGFLTATDTLLSQSHGANQREGFAIWTGNSLVVVFAVTILVAGIVALCGPAMRLLGQDPYLADEAGKFSLRLIPGLFPYYAFKVLTKYLQTQNRLAPGVWIGIFANLLNALFNWGLIFGAGMGLAGAPWATTLTRLAEFLLILLYIRVRRTSLRDTMPVFSRENMTREAMRPYWKLAVSGCLSFSAEAWSFEITTILAGLLGTVPLDAHTVTLTIATFMFLSFPFAVGIAASIRVGQLIGDRRSEDARRSAHTSYVLSALLVAALIVILLPCREILGNLFSSDEDVAQLVSELIPISCIFMMGDSVQATTGGILRGLGRQKLVLWLNIVAFWILAVPLGAVLTFGIDLGVYGLWWGMVIGIYSTALLGLWFLRRVDWSREANKAQVRLSSIISTRRTVDPDEFPDEESDSIGGANTQ